MMKPQLKEFFDRCLLGQYIEIKGEVIGQSERLNPEDHIVDVNKMVCDSLNHDNK